MPSRAVRPPTATGGPAAAAVRNPSSGRRTLLAGWVISLVATFAGLGSGAVNAAPADHPATTDPGPAVENCPPTAGHYGCLSSRVPLPAPGGRRAAAIGPAAALTAYGPADLAAAYRLPTSRSTATIAIIDAYDAPHIEADLAHYRAHYGLPACTTANGCFAKINQHGGAAMPAADAGWAAESTLDVEMVSAICRTCHILLVEADDNNQHTANMTIAVQTATRRGARYVSMSWGGSEQPGQLQADRTYLSVPGVTYVAASGDSDYGVLWPASYRNVVSVGGTTLRRDPSRARGWAETVWGYTNGTGTGSGCSTYETQALWQRVVVPASLCRRRVMNDVSIVGDPHTGVAVFMGGSWYQFGGTSAGSPMIAALYAMAGAASATSSAYYPYAHLRSFNDITDNANGYCGNRLCTATGGWDGPSGNGTPIGLSGFTARNLITLHTPAALATTTGSAITIHIRAADTGGARVRYTATGLPRGTHTRPDGVIAGTPTTPGTYRVTVTATDTQRSTATVTFTWTITHHR